MKRLVYFTNYYPLGYDTEWHRGEFEHLARTFDEIVIAPLTVADGGPQVEPLGHYRVLPPALASGDSVYRRRDVARLLNTRILHRLRDLFISPGAMTPRKVRKLATRSLAVERILASQNFRASVLPELTDACLYFFWAKGYAEVLPFLPASLQLRSAVRFHGYDLYRERDDGWIPGQRLLVKSSALLLPISSHGGEYLAQSYPGVAGRIHVHRLGCRHNKPASRSSDGILRIVSCAFAHPVKRLHLIPSALRHCRRRVQWTHIGDGPELPRIRALTDALGSHIETVFLGNLTPSAVRQTYATGIFDLFVNVSESEGIPISVMEALAAGIPICATNVGGNSEIVDSKVGYLLPSDFSEEQFLEVIEKVAVISAAVAFALRDACIRRHAEEFDSNRNAGRLAAELSALPGELSGSLLVPSAEQTDVLAPHG